MLQSNRFYSELKRLVLTAVTGVGVETVMVIGNWMEAKLSKRRGNLLALLCWTPFSEACWSWWGGIPGFPHHQSLLCRPAYSATPFHCHASSADKSRRHRFVIVWHSRGGVIETELPTAVPSEGAVGRGFSVDAVCFSRPNQTGAWSRPTSQREV